MDGTTPPTRRPGTRLFAPQARLVDEQGTPLAIAGQPLSADLISATVTLVNHGVSQVDLVLNNQRHDAEHRPMVPTWRYNGLDPIGFGKRLRVDLRYGDEGWMPMILARVTDMEFSFPAAAGAQVTLKGEDLLSLLKVKPDQDQPYHNQHEVDIVEEVLRRAGGGLALATPRPAPVFSNPLPSITHEASKTYLEFIQGLAERMDHEVFVAFDDPRPGPGGANPASPGRRPVRLHVTPARSASLGEPVELRWGRDIIDFKPSFKVWDVRTAAVAAGRPPRGRGSFSERVEGSGPIDDLHPAPGKATPLAAVTARERAFAAENRPAANTETIAVQNLDAERARRQATAALRRSARQFLTADLTTVGLPGLRPGRHLNLTGFSAPFDGIWYLTQTVHSLTAAGYTTKVSLRRPGMLDPSGYPAATGGA